MNDFIENAIAAIMKHVQIVSESAKKKNTKTVYLMGAEHACDVLKAIAGNDVVKVIRCVDCKYYELDYGVCCRYVKGDDGLRDPREDEFCSRAERKEKA